VDAISREVQQDACLWTMLSNGLLRVESVDGSQGSEADYVLLSMVRCVPSEGMGFLNKQNRLCVAFSRAKLLLLVIGHAKTFKKSSNKLLQSLVKVFQSKFTNKSKQCRPAIVKDEFYVLTDFLPKPLAPAGKTRHWLASCIGIEYNEKTMVPRFQEDFKI
jgi:hypothetical protein